MAFTYNNLLAVMREGKGKAIVRITPRCRVIIEKLRTRYRVTFSVLGNTRTLQYQNAYEVYTQINFMQWIAEDASRTTRLRVRESIEKVAAWKAPHKE